MATLQERLDAINAKLDSGSTMNRIGDRQEERDLAELRRQRDEILREMNGGSQFRRVVFQK